MKESNKEEAVVPSHRQQLLTVTVSSPDAEDAEPRVLLQSPAPKRSPSPAVLKLETLPGNELQVSSAAGGGGGDGPENNNSPNHNHQQQHQGNNSERRQLSVSATLLRSGQVSAKDAEKLQDKVRRDRLNACRLLLTQACPNGRLLKAHDFFRLLADPKFLDELFGLFDHQEADHLVQDQWISSLKHTQCNPAGRDFAELVESVAYILVQQENVNLAVFRRIFSSRGVLEKFFRLVDADKDDVVSVPEIMETITNMTMPGDREHSLTAENLALLEKMFREHMSRDSEIHLDEFRAILNSKNPFFAERVFSIFDRDGSGAISLAEFLESMGRFATQNHDEKISFLFQIYDVDGDGLIQRTELQAVLRACMDENGMNFSDEQIEDLTYALYEDADATGNEITYDALKAQLMKHEGLLENLSISIERWLVPPKKSTQGKSHSFQLPYQLTMPYIKNNYVYLIFVGLIIATNIILAAKRIYDFRTSNGFIIVARICGQCLNFNSTFILVLMLRHTLTFLRNHGLASVLPLDQHIYLHKVCGWLILSFALVHTVAHLANIAYFFMPVLDKLDLTYAEWLFTTRPAPNFYGKPINYGLVTAWANPTGCALVVILIVMVLCSLPCVRKSGNFEIFYWTHLLYIPYWVILVLHCKNFWKWLVGPGIIFLIERLVRVVRMSSNSGRTYISSGIMLPSKVTHLVVKRPPNFFYSAGDYVFVNIPAIAKYEWHPFTISSAPELEDYIWLHIRGVGQWTNRLYNHFAAEQAKLENMKHTAMVPMEGLLKGLTVPKKPAKGRPRSGFQNIKRKISQSFRPSNRDSVVVTNSHEMAINGSASAAAMRNGGGSGGGNGLVNQAFGGTEPMVSISLGRNNGDSPPNYENGQGDCPSSPSATSDVFLQTSPSPAGMETATHRRKTRFLSTGKKPALPTSKYSPASTGATITVVPPSQRKVEKTKSLPDLEVNMRRRNKNLLLREKGRATSEHAFDDQTLQRAVIQASGSSSSAYKSPQNRSVAYSFRYMRRKPTIVALETPRNSEAFGDTNSTIGPGTSQLALSANTSGIRNKDRRSVSANLVSALETVAEEEHTQITASGAGGKEGHQLMVVPAAAAAAAAAGDTSAVGGDSSSKAMMMMMMSDADEEVALREREPRPGIDYPVGKALEIFLDGPYGAPSSHIFRAQHAVLVGTGIGVTPFASILQSIMHRYWNARQSCPNCRFTWCSTIPKSIMHLRKVDFFWINRDQMSFEWFVELLSQLEMEQAELGGAMERFLDMHMYISSALQKTDMKALGLQLALDLLHEKEKRDLITGLKTRTVAGRPNWTKVFQQIAEQNKGKVTVFFCGPPELARVLRVKCHEFGFAFRKESF